MLKILSVLHGEARGNRSTAVDVYLKVALPDDRFQVGITLTSREFKYEDFCQYANFTRSF